MGPLVVAVALLTGLLVLIPTRRLQLAGWSANVLGAYYLTVWGLSVVVALEPAFARFLLPFLLIAYLAPFVTLRDGLDRLRRRGGSSGWRIGRRPGTPSRPMKDVTPRDDPAPTSPEEQASSGQAGPGSR